MSTRLTAVAAIGIGIAVLSELFAGCGKSIEHKIDDEVGWHEIKPHYDAPIRGFKIGNVTVPGHTQQVRFYMWGIPKDDLADEDEEPYIFGEMDRDSHMVLSLEEDLKFSDLGRLAFAAYNHGGMRIILSGRKAYVVTSDEEQWLSYEAERAQ